MASIIKLLVGLSVLHTSHAAPAVVPLQPEVAVHEASYEDDLCSGRPDAYVVSVGVHIRCCGGKSIGPSRWNACCDGKHLQGATFGVHGLKCCGDRLIAHSEKCCNTNSGKVPTTYDACCDGGKGPYSETYMIGPQKCCDGNVINRFEDCPSQAPCDADQICCGQYDGYQPQGPRARLYEFQKQFKPQCCSGQPIPQQDFCCDGKHVEYDILRGQENLVCCGANAVDTTQCCNGQPC